MSAESKMLKWARHPHRGDEWGAFTSDKGAGLGVIKAHRGRWWWKILDAQNAIDANLMGEVLDKMAEETGEDGKPIIAESGSGKGMIVPATEMPPLPNFVENGRPKRRRSG